MENYFKYCVESAAFVVGAGGIITITVGALGAGYWLITNGVARRFDVAERKKAWRRFASLSLVGLEFILAAFILKTAISPSWSALGQIAAIAVIRTFLNHALTRDVDADYLQFNP